MTAAKIYGDKELYEVFQRVVNKEESSFKSEDVAEALRIRRRGLNIDAIVSLLVLDEGAIKKILDTVRYAEKVAEKWDVVPELYELN